jgi:two-component system, chemotaxis family, chemotaxis protein CheY
MSARVLLVEDSRVVRRMVRDALSMDGHEIHEAEDGRQGLQAVERVAPDLVITDVNMPEMDGIALTRAIRGLPRFRFTPILILTTESSDAMKDAGRSAGATGWIVKPFEPVTLRGVVARVLGGLRVAR